MLVLFRSLFPLSFSSRSFSFHLVFRLASSSASSSSSSSSRKSSRFPKRQYPEHLIVVPALFWAENAMGRKGKARFYSLELPQVEQIAPGSGVRAKVWYGQIFLEPVQNGHARAVSFGKFAYYAWYLDRISALGAYFSRKLPRPSGISRNSSGFRRFRKSFHHAMSVDSRGAREFARKVRPNRTYAIEMPGVIGKFTEGNCARVTVLDCF